MKILAIHDLKPPILVLHGGAGRWLSRHRRGLIDEALNQLLYAALSGLAQRSALSMVIEAVAVLEDSGVFNAGVGSVLNYVGDIEMDAGVMTSTGVIGAVGATKYPRNPVRLALEVARRTRHILLAGQGADMLAKRLSLPPHPGPSPRQLERYREARRRADRMEWVKPLHELYDTVGAVAVDEQGVLAAAASTGGILLKHPGRIGDSAIPGAGFYTTKRAACSATGIGEQMIALQTCRSIVELIEAGLNPVDAVKKLMKRHGEAYGPGGAGVIVVSSEGVAVAGINTEAMPIAVADAVSASSLLLS